MYVRCASSSWMACGQYLVVIHTFEQTGPNEATIRIISARPAERVEIKDYQDTPR